MVWFNITAYGLDKLITQDRLFERNRNLLYSLLCPLPKMLLISGSTVVTAQSCIAQELFSK